MEILAISQSVSDILMAIAIGAIIIGIIFGIIEMCLPGFGIFGAIGSFLCLIGIILHIFVGGNLFISIIILVGTSAFFTLLFLIIGRSAIKGRLSKTALVSSELAVPTGATQGTPDFSAYLGKSGETITDLRPVGKAKIGDDVIEVVSHGSMMISKGEKVIVSFIEGGKVQVQLAE